MKHRIPLNQIILLSLALVVLSGCVTTPATTETAPQPTPTLLGTVSPPPQPAPTPTEARRQCLFRLGAQDEAGLYRFNWLNFTFSIDTKIGTVIIDAAHTLEEGPRQLILAHNSKLPQPFGLAFNIDVGSTLIYDPAAGAQEVRDAGGTVTSQSLTDARGDANGLPAYLDIIRMERTFGYYPNNTVRVYLADVRTAPQIWTFQAVSVMLGGVTYTRKAFADGRVDHLVTDAKGKVAVWDGPITVEGNVLTFMFQTGVDQPMGGATATSGGAGDVVSLFPASRMQTLWDGAARSCR